MVTRPAWVQTQLDLSVTPVDGTHTSYTVNLLHAWTAGNSLAGYHYLEMGLGNTTFPTITITDNATPSNTYTVLDHLLDIGSTTNWIVSWGLARVLGAPTTITFSYSINPNGGTIYFIAEELSGAGFIDQHTIGATTPAAATLTSGNVTTTAPDLVFGFVSPATATTVSAGSSYTLRTNDTTLTLYSESQLQATKGTIAATFGVSPNATGVTSLIAFAPDDMFLWGRDTSWVQFPVRVRPSHYALAAISKRDEEWPFTATPNPLKMQGIYYDPQFPQRTRQDPRQARGDEQWPFTAVPTPAQVGWEWRPEFARAHFRPSRSADEEWPFTAVPTPAQFGWDNPERFSQRVRFRPSRSADEQWPFTATLTPGPLGWQVQDPFPQRRRFQPGVLLAEVFSPAQATQTPTGLEWAWDPQFPSRLRFRTFQSSDEQWPFTAAVTPGQFGWDNPERFPARLRFRTFQQADEQWPFTAIGTPGQFGWQLDPQFAIRRRFRTFQFANEQWPFTSVPTPAAFGFAWDPQFPFRIRYRPLTLTDEQWSFTATPTPTQFGWHLDPQVPTRARFRPQLAQFDITTFTPATLTPTNIDFAYPPEFFSIRQRFRPLIHETFNPQPPIISPTFQTMQAGATKIKLNTGATFVTINLKGTGAFVFSPVATPTILNEALPFGSAQVVLTSGTTPVSVALAASNDGVNFVQVGPAATNFPMIINLTALPLLSIVPYAYHAWIVTGGDATTQLTITEIFTGWRG